MSEYDIYLRHASVRGGAWVGFLLAWRGLHRRDGLPTRPHLYERPWVLDPVFVDRSRERAGFAQMLAARKPSAVRLNQIEFTALADAAPTDAVIERYALDQRCVVALTGAADVLTDGKRMVKIGNGDPIMGRVTAMGCAGAAVITACLAIEADAWMAAAAGLLIFAVAGECAAAEARGPGSFAVEILDALARLARETFRHRARLA